MIPETGDDAIPGRRWMQHEEDCGIRMRLDDGSSMVVPEAAGLPEYSCTCGLDAFLAEQLIDWESHRQDDFREGARKLLMELSIIVEGDEWKSAAIRRYLRHAFVEGMKLHAHLHVSEVLPRG